MFRPLSGIRQTVRQILRDEFVQGSTQDWTDDEIDIHIDQTIEEISQVSPNVVIEVLSTVANSKVLDISDIADLITIEKLEYLTGGNPRNYRNYDWIDRTTIEIDMDSTPSAGETGVLTGTVTFTSGSAAITGSGTAFTAELVAGDHIKTSTGTRYYRIHSIESATALTLAEPCRAVDTGADTINVTVYLKEAVYIYCHKLHTLTDDDSTLKADEEKVLIDGAVAYVASSYVGNLRTQVAAATNLITDINKVINGVAHRIDQAIDDLEKGRGQIDDERATANTAIDDVTAGINRALDDLALGETYINKVNYGGNPESDYGVYASKELQAATEKLQQANVYLALHSTSGRHADFASRELSIANNHINQAGGYVRELTARLSIAGVINSYQSWANNKLVLYKRALSKIEKPKNWRDYPKD